MLRADASDRAVTKKKRTHLWIFRLRMYGVCRTLKT